MNDESTQNKRKRALFAGTLCKRSKIEGNIMPYRLEREEPYMLEMELHGVWRRYGPLLTSLLLN